MDFQRFKPHLPWITLLVLVAIMGAGDDTLTEPVACVVRAARKAQVGFGQSVVVLGGGPMGNLDVQMMRLVGAAPIIVADLSQDRCQMALDASADAVVSDPAQLVARVQALTGGRGADLVIESVGSPPGYLPPPKPRSARAVT